jgi:signal peptidase
MSKKKNLSTRKLMTVITYLVIAFAIVLFTLSWLSGERGLSFRTFVIQSGSMEPSIMTGDIVVIKPEEAYYQAEVITYLDKDKRIVTHRILQVNQQEDSIYYETKGDANQSPDSHPISNPNIIGKVNFVIPKLGFAVAFAQSKQGRTLFIIIPAALIIYDELKKIAVEVKN